jgi:hypothetical protein
MIGVVVLGCAPRVASRRFGIPGVASRFGAGVITVGVAGSTYELPFERFARIDCLVTKGSVGF